MLTRLSQFTARPIDVVVKQSDDMMWERHSCRDCRGRNAAPTVRVRLFQSRIGTGKNERQNVIGWQALPYHKNNKAEERNDAPPLF